MKRKRKLTILERLGRWLYPDRGSETGVMDALPSPQLVERDRDDAWDRLKMQEAKQEVREALTGLREATAETLKIFSQLYSYQEYVRCNAELNKLAVWLRGKEIRPAAAESVAEVVIGVLEQYRAAEQGGYSLHMKLGEMDDCLDRVHEWLRSVPGDTIPRQTREELGRVRLIAKQLFRRTQQEDHNAGS